MKLFVTFLVVTVLVTCAAASPSFASGRFARLAHKVHHVQKQNKHLRWEIRSLRYDLQANFVTLGCWTVRLYTFVGMPFTYGGNEDDWCQSFYAAPEPDTPPNG